MAEPGLDAAVRDGLAVVERELRSAVDQADPLADDVARHLVQAGGKRVRPMLTLLAAHLGDATRAEVVRAAVVVELTHLATLYHDDVMDGAQLRRGAPSAHAVWGNTVAILTGDLLFARASRIVADLGVEAVQIQATTFERLCLGQLHETVGPGDIEDPVVHYLQVLSDKTGSLIATSARFGAMFAGCDRAVQDVLVTYGEKVGVAFQLADDVIDLRSDGSVTGKTPGTDLREHVPTLPALLLRRHVERTDDPESTSWSRCSTATCPTTRSWPTSWPAWQRTRRPSRPAPRRTDGHRPPSPHWSRCPPRRPETPCVTSPLPSSSAPPEQVSPGLLHAQTTGPVRVRPGQTTAPRLASPDVAMASTSHGVALSPGEGSRRIRAR